MKEPPPSSNQPPLWRRLAWFAGLWALGVGAVALCGLVLRAWLKV